MVELQVGPYTYHMWIILEVRHDLATVAATCWARLRKIVLGLKMWRSYESGANNYGRHNSCHLLKVLDVVSVVHPVFLRSI